MFLKKQPPTSTVGTTPTKITRGYRVSGSPAARSVTVRPARRGLFAFAGGRPNAKPSRLLSSFHRPAWFPSTRNGRRVSLLSSFAGLTVALILAGWTSGYLTNDEFPFIVLAVGLPTLLTFPFAAAHVGLVVASGLHRIRFLRYRRWPKFVRFVLAAGAGTIGGAVTFIAVQLPVDIAGVPVGLAVVVFAAVAAIIFDWFRLRGFYDIALANEAARADGVIRAGSVSK